MPSPKSGTQVQTKDPEEPKVSKGTGGKTGSVEAKGTSGKGGDSGSTKVDDKKGAEKKNQEDEKKKEKKEPEPTIEAKWSKSEVTPNHNASFPPSTPPTDSVPDEARVKMLVTTTEVPDGTGAAIMVYSHVGAPVGEALDQLEVKGGKVVDKSTGKEPEWVFEAEHQPWTPFETPFFYFRVTVSYKGLEAETPSDPDKQEKECLRVVYWHACVSDTRADSNDGLTTGAEMAEIAGILGGTKHHKVLQQGFNQRNVAVNLWGSVMRNTLAYHHASHGDIVDRSTGAQLNAGNQNPPTNAVGNWRSVICLGSSDLGDAEVSQQANVPSAPRYLAYLDTCVAGWEPSFANAFLNRGTQNVIAFRMYIPDGAARKMARDFYKKWCNTHKCNPDKIPVVFFETGAPHYASMRPVLFGQGAGAIKSPARQAAEAVTKAISNAVKGLSSLLK